MNPVHGVLEVGTTGQGEIVINHPDLQPDENGVGHIVFSVEQALNLARILVKKADEADQEIGPDGLSARQRRIRDALLRGGPHGNPKA